MPLHIYIPRSSINHIKTKNVCSIDKFDSTRVFVLIDCFYYLTNLVFTWLSYNHDNDVLTYCNLKRPGDEDYEEDEDEMQESGTLLTSLADAQTRQREKAAYEQLKAGGLISFNIFPEIHLYLSGCFDTTISV